MAKFQFYAQFPVDTLSYPIMPSSEFLLSWFVATAYYVINSFLFQPHIIVVVVVDVLIGIAIVIAKIQFYKSFLI